MKAWLIALLAMFCLCPVWGAEKDMAEDIVSGQFWNMKSGEVVKKYVVGELYSWLDEAKSQLRIRNQGGLVIGSFAPEMYTFVQRDDQFQSIEVMVYNRGDDGDLPKDVFEARVQETVKTLDGALGVEGKSQGRANKRQSAVAERSWLWVWEHGAAVMEVASSGKKKDFQAEYIRLRLGKTEESITKGGARDAVSRRDVRENVEVEGKRVRIKGIPMVDQGDKGYCVPATVARVFAFYGMDGVDQHALAALCSSSSDGGTSTLEMQRGLEEICTKFHVKLVNLDSQVMKKGFDWINSYNKKAEKAGSRLLSPYRASLEGADPEILEEVRGKDTAVDKWMKPIRKSIQAGVPVLWCVELGLYPEPKRLDQTQGGHMRLIIGYDDEERTILFSDSWGAGHEMKEMPQKQACAMSVSRYMLRLSR